MNILLFNTYENLGGAAIATYRLHCALRLIGINSHLLVQNKKTDDSSVISSLTKWARVISSCRLYLDGVLTKFYHNRKKVYFSPAWVPDNLTSKIKQINPDIIHLFWVNNGFFRIETLKKFKQPVVWTLHDMWPFTGGCHYDEECGRYKQSCGRCPMLQSEKENDLSRRVFLRKLNSWQNTPIIVVATSKWLAEMARSSAIFKNQRVEVIPNGIDTEKYKPINKEVARATYNLPQDKNLILFSAFSAISDKRKGHQFLVEALKIMTQEGWGSKAEIVIIGASKPENPPDLGMKVHYMGYLQDEISQVLLYSAADMVVAPSIQENLSNTVMESLSCGTPVVAFNIGGMPDMIDHQLNGYLATPFQSSDLANGIKWILENKCRQASLSLYSRKSAEERYALNVVASRYLELYKSVLA